MQGTGGQELRADTVELHCHSWLSAKDPDTFDARCVVCSSTRLVRIKIDDNYFACAVRDCFWGFHCIGETYGHPKVNHPILGSLPVLFMLGTPAICSTTYASVSLEFCGRLST